MGKKKPEVEFPKEVVDAFQVIKDAIIENADNMEFCKRICAELKGLSAFFEDMTGMPMEEKGNEDSYSSMGED
jgi:hypothetical protein